MIQRHNKSLILRLLTEEAARAVHEAACSQQRAAAYCATRSRTTEDSEVATHLQQASEFYYNRARLLRAHAASYEDALRDLHELANIKEAV